MSEALFEVDTPPAAPQPVVDERKWTERDVLDLIHDRYTKAQPGNGPRYIVAEHVRNYCGFAGYRTRTPLRTIDALAVDLWPSSGHVIHGFEVKVSRSDWLTELKDPEKAEAFKPYCDHWWLVTPTADIVRGDLPRGWGHLVATPAGSLRVRAAAPKLAREAMPFEMTAAWLRAAAKTASRSSGA